MHAMSSVSRHDDFLTRLQAAGDRHEAAEQDQQKAHAAREAELRRAAADPGRALAEVVVSVRQAAEQLRAAAEETRQVNAEMMRVFKAFINDLDRRLR
jgi:hypothetical protein